MWRMPINKKSLHLYSNLESPRSFHSRCFSLLKGTRGGRFNFERRGEDAGWVRGESGAKAWAKCLPLNLPAATCTKSPGSHPASSLTSPVQNNPSLPFMPHSHSPGPIWWMNAASLWTTSRGRWECGKSEDFTSFSSRHFCHFLAHFLYPVFTAPSV